MKHGKRGRRTKPQNVPVIYQIQSGQKLLYQQSKDGGWGLNLVDASVNR